MRDEVRGKGPMPMSKPASVQNALSRGRDSSRRIEDVPRGSPVDKSSTNAVPRASYAALLSLETPELSVPDDLPRRFTGKSN